MPPKEGTTSQPVRLLYPDFSHIALALLIIAINDEHFAEKLDLLFRYGRRIIMLPSTTFVLLFGFISSFSPTLWFYILARAVIGFFTPGSGIQSFVLISEFVGPKWRPFAGITLWLIYAVSVVILGVIAIFVQTWKTLMIVITAPYFFVLLFFL